MSSRVQKQKKSQSARRRKSELLKIFSSGHSVPMSSYGSCLRRGIETYQVSPNDSSRCELYIRSNRLGCDVVGVSDAQIQNIVQFYAKFEREVAVAISEVMAVTARLQRVQKQKELWGKRLLAAFERGLCDVEELERMEVEERVQAIVEIMATNVEQVESIVGIDWSLLSDFALDPGLLADLGIPRSVETLCDTQLDS